MSKIQFYSTGTRADYDGKAEGLMAYELIKEVAESHYGVILSDEKILLIIEAEPDLKHYADSPRSGSMDTYDREGLSGFLVTDVLGPGRYWPMNGDGPDALPRFWEEFKPAALAKGYSLYEGDPL